MDSPAAAAGWRPEGSRVAITALLAFALYVLAFDHGTYATGQRATVGLVVWWVIGITSAAAVLRPSLGRSGAIAATGLVALAVLDLLSQFWSHDATSAFDEFDRVIVYLGVLILAASVAGRFGVGAVADAIGAGTAAIGVTAVLARCFPGLAGDRTSAAFQLIAVNRLSFPLDYWNGLAIFVGLGVPVLLWRASSASTWMIRG